jgi:hypothetical protein
MKIDVEGMEEQVLEGARETILRAQPVLYVENNHLSDGMTSTRLITFIQSELRYRCFWHRFETKLSKATKMQPPYIEGNMICIHRGRRKDLREAARRWNGTVGAVENPLE